MSPSVRKIMKDVFKQASSNPDNFFHIMGTAYDNAVFNDDGEVENERLNKEFLDYISGFRKGLDGLESGYY